MRMRMRMREHTKDTRHVDHNAKKKAEEEEEDDNACLRCCLEPWLTVPECAGAAVSQWCLKVLVARCAYKQTHMHIRTYVRAYACPWTLLFGPCARAHARTRISWATRAPSQTTAQSRDVPPSLWDAVSMLTSSPPPGRDCSRLPRDVCWRHRRPDKNSLREVVYSQPLR